MRRFSILVLFIVGLTACTSDKKEATSTSQPSNPAAEGFNVDASDSAAVSIADSVMMAMGGRAAWDKLRFISWNFFGIRDLIWDKKTGRVRIDFPRDSMVYLVNINSGQGQVFKNNEKVTNPDSISKYVDQGISIWNNDAYWLVMPFKLKDSGVTLKYAREDTTRSGIESHVLTLKFENVGDTPDNKYEIYVDKSDYMVKQWSYFRTFSQDSASAVWPWDNYKNYSGVLLSADRSDKRGPKDVKVYESLPDSVFESKVLPKL